MDDAPTVEIRPYDAGDADALWKLKRAFELGLGDGTGGDGKRAAYEAKLGDGYRERYLDWVERCVEADDRCVTVAAVADGSGRDDATTTESESGSEGETRLTLAGYVFVLPERLSMIWDAAVLNEIYVAPAHRGTGVADELLAAAVDLSREQSLPLDRLVLDVDRENDRASAFYERHGFEHWGEMVARPLGDGDDDGRDADVRDGGAREGAGRRSPRE